MEYQECRMGRTFVARLHEGEPIYQAIESLAEREKIASATVLALGGIRRGGVVTGPVDPESPCVYPTLIERFADARELVGIGTIFPRDGRPALHFHAGIGRGREALVGCPREEAVCFLVLEVVVIEWLGLQAERILDPVSGFALLELPT